MLAALEEVARHWQYWNSLTLLEFTGTTVVVKIFQSP